jgi:hypothetical protein
LKADLRPTMAAPVVSGEAETRVQETADDAALSKM